MYIYNEAAASFDHIWSSLGSTFQNHVILMVIGATRSFYYWNHALTNHVLFIYISTYFPAEDAGCYLARDAVTYQASFPGEINVVRPRYESC
jgi:hypothetical protein